MSDSDVPDSPSGHSAEPHAGGLGQRLNWLRAGVLGANDGIVSTAGLVVGVAAVTPEPGPILTAGIAGLVAGAVSMALGEYVSVSSQRDTERALLAKEKAELEEFPEQELQELAAIYVAKGASVQTAMKLAEELTAHGPFAAHVDAELGIDPDELTNPWHAATSSAIAFTVGSVPPIVAILLPPAGIRVPVTFVVVLLALALTGALSAYLGGARCGRRRWPVWWSGERWRWPSPTASASSSGPPGSESSRPFSAVREGTRGGMKHVSQNQPRVVHPPLVALSADARQMAGGRGKCEVATSTGSRCPPLRSGRAGPALPSRRPTRTHPPRLRTGIVGLLQRRGTMRADGLPLKPWAGRRRRRLRPPASGGMIKGASSPWWGPRSGQVAQQRIRSGCRCQDPDTGIDDQQVLPVADDRVQIQLGDFRQVVGQGADAHGEVGERSSGHPWCASISVEQHRGPQFREHVLGVLHTQRCEPERSVGNHIRQDAAGTDHHRRPELIVLDGAEDHLGAGRCHRLHQHRRPARTQRCQLREDAPQFGLVRDTEADPADVGLVHATLGELHCQRVA